MPRRTDFQPYFFGGGYQAGDGSELRYDGASMAGKGIVAVTVNYRLNIFGFFAHAELSREAPYHASGNYGLLDQSAVLRWVQQNIAASGGDPKKVTIAGESDGSLRSVRPCDNNMKLRHTHNDESGFGEFILVLARGGREPPGLFTANLLKHTSSSMREEAVNA